MKTRIIPRCLPPKALHRRPWILAASIAILTILGSAGADADVVATYTGATGGISADGYYFGQPFTTAAGSPETNITFNWYANTPPITPIANGTGFLLSAAYTGSPNGLSSSTPGFLGETVASGEVFSFGSVVLQPNTTYYFYAASPTSGAYTLAGVDFSVPGGSYYFSGASDGAFAVQSSASLNFLVTGSPFATAPATLYWDGRTNGLWTAANWATSSGDAQTALLPGATADVIFSIPAGAANQGITALGQNFTIHSLTVNDSTPVVINNGPGGIYTLTIAGNAGTGITVNAGANLTINSNVTLAGSSDTIATNGASVATINSILFAANGVNKTGTGALFLDGLVIGNVQATQGQIGGTGLIQGNLTNAAVVSPGDAPGTLRVSGNYAQAPGGALVTKFAGYGPGQHDLLQVNGNASLAGTLVLLNVGGAQGLKIGQIAPFLTAAQGISGRFGAVVDLLGSTGTLVIPELVYGPTSISIEGGQGSFYQLARAFQLSPNEQSVAHALDIAAAKGRSGALISYLDSQPLSAIPGDLAKLDPEQLTSMFTVAIGLANVQSLNLQRRAEDIRSGSTGFSAAGFAMNGSNPGYSGTFGIDTGVAGPEGPDGKEMKGSAPIPAQQRWGAFLSGTGNWVNVGNTSSADGYKLDSGGFTLGVDYKVCDHFTVGLSFGYTGTTSDLNENGGRIFANGGKMGIYSTAYSGAWYIDTAVNGGYNSYDTDRNSLGGVTRGSTDGGELNVLFGTGYDFKAGGLTFGPVATFNYTYVGLGEFSERGSLGPLDIHGNDEESLRTALGFKVGTEWKAGSALIKPQLRVAWQHEYGDTAYSLYSNFANGAGDAFLVEGPKIGRDSVLLSAGFAVQFSERCSVFAYYDGELARTNYHQSSISGGIRIDF